METKKLLEHAFELISTIPVSGTHVEVMAQAKAELRAVYAALGEKKEEKAEVKEDG